MANSVVGFLVIGKFLLTLRRRARAKLIPIPSYNGLGSCPHRGVTGVNFVDDAFGRDASACHSGQVDDGSIDQWSPFPYWETGQLLPASSQTRMG